MSRVLVNPKMIDEKEVRLLLKNISSKEIINDADLTVKDMYRIWRCIAPEHAEELIRRESNHKKAKDGTIHKDMPAMISQMFLNCIFWEAHEFDGASFERQHDKADIVKRIKAVNKQVSRILDENKKAEKEKEEAMEGKGLITQHELERQLAEQKEKHDAEMDKKYRDDRKSFMALQKQVANHKHNANFYEGIVDKQKKQIEYYERENHAFTLQSSNNPPEQS